MLMKRLKFWFEKFEITSWWKKKIEELSKGMQQKVQFIVTVVHEPTLLILDEPFTGFDPINANLIKDELLEMKAKGVTIALSTHRMESVEELCTHIALINKSKKLLEGPVGEIRRSFRSNMYEYRV
jgi:ABC-2 type transport system ATP-binding protein